MDKHQLRLSYFAEQLQAAYKMAEVLEYSYRQVAAMPDMAGGDMSQEHAAELEALSARFARFADSLTQKLFRAVDALELVDEGSLIDRLARVEKRGIIASADAWAEIRELRNQIAHDYIVADLAGLHLSVFQHCPALAEALNNVSRYAAERGWKNNGAVT
jgi:uncharacterized protein YutE (UPF0331/DUF86 family)